MEQINNIAETTNALHTGAPDRSEQVSSPETDTVKPSLTIREKEILSYLAKGHTTSQIAILLYISFDTVETHRRNILRKLKVKNIVAAVAYAVRLKIID